jgi:hypothetical protein
MIRLVSRSRRFGLAAALTLSTAAFLGAGWLPVGAQSVPAGAGCPAGPPVLSLANPNPGDLLPQGEEHSSCL